MIPSRSMKGGMSSVDDLISEKDLSGGVYSTCTRGDIGGWVVWGGGAYPCGETGWRRI
jgi:hypothetical protein